MNENEQRTYEDGVDEGFFKGANFLYTFLEEYYKDKSFRKKFGKYLMTRGVGGLHDYEVSKGDYLSSLVSGASGEEVVNAYMTYIVWKDEIEGEQK